MGVVQRQISMMSLNDARPIESLVKGIMTHVHSFHKVCGCTHGGSQQKSYLLPMVTVALVSSCKRPLPGYCRQIHTLIGAELFGSVWFPQQPCGLARVCERF